MPSRKFLTPLLAVLCLACSGLRADQTLDRYLVARWTFNNGSLKSDRGDFTLKRMDWGLNPGLELSDGQARIGPGTLLVCGGINGKTSPKLTSGITIWIRLRIEEPLSGDAFLYGLRDKTEPGDWGDLVFGGICQPGQPGHTSLFCRFADKYKFGRSSGLPELKPGAFHSVAMIFDSGTNTVTYRVDDQTVEGRQRNMMKLDDFDNFGIGRLKAAAASPEMSVDEIRIYDVALSPEWVDEINPVSSR